MHHFGMGLPKDYHLSKRFYDAAAEKSTEGMPRKFRAREFQIGISNTKYGCIF